MSDVGMVGRALLEVRDLRVRFPSSEGVVAAVNGVTFGIGAGESVGIVGESGSGKSVTALSVMGLVKGANISGEVRFGGRDLLALRPTEWQRVRGREIGMIFQDPMSSLNPIQKIGNQIAEVVEAHLGLSRSAALKRAVELLEMVGIPHASQRLSDLPHEFSGGMRQRVMIAMAVSCHPKLLIADEPTTALDVTTQAQVLALIRRLRDELGMALMIITHDFGVVREVAHRINVMYAGTIVETGFAPSVIATPWHPYSEGLLASVPDINDIRRSRLPFVRGKPPNPVALPRGCPFTPRCEYALDKCGESAPPERAQGGRISLCWLEPGSLAGRQKWVPDEASPATSTASERAAPLLALDGLRVRYVRRWRLGSRRMEPVHAVDGVSFIVYSGETLGLVGESGSGKSSIGRAILRLAPITEGTISFDGLDIGSASTQQMREVGRSLKIVFQDSVATLDPRMTVAEIVEEPLRIHRVASREGRFDRVRHVLSLVGLGDHVLFRYPHELSGGQRQRVGVARAVVLSPKFIICDEPVSALDVSIQAQVINLFHDLKDELGLTYLFISHDLRVMRQTADRIAVMYRGRIVETSPTDELFTNPKHPYTQLLLASVPESSLSVPVSGDTDAAETPAAGAVEGCVFADRCPHARQQCRELSPMLEPAAPHVQVACHFWKEVSLQATKPAA